MKKKLSLIGMVLVLTAALAGCGNGNQGADDSQAVTSQQEKHESLLGYSIAYNSTRFALDEAEDSDVFTYQATDLLAPVYLTVQKYSDMDAQTLAEGLVLQSGNDGVAVQDAVIGADSIEAKSVYIETEEKDVKQIQIFYAIPAEEGSLLLEMGTYEGISEAIDAEFEEMLATFRLK